VVLALENWQTRIEVRVESGVVSVRVSDLPPEESAPLALLIPMHGQGDPILKEPEKQEGVEYLIARYEGVEPGEYLLAFEPISHAKE
jgi:hypothetical protein